MRAPYIEPLCMPDRAASACSAPRELDTSTEGRASGVIASSAVEHPNAERAAPSAGYPVFGGFTASDFIGGEMGNHEATVSTSNTPANSEGQR